MWVATICTSCGINLILEPEYVDDLDAKCPVCKSYIWEQDEDFGLTSSEEEIANYSGDNYCGGVRSIDDW